MGANTHIQWTDHTFNGWEGCTKVSPGCAHCYAETRNKRFSDGVNWGKGAPRRRTSVSNWNLPRKWNRDAGGEGPETLECPSCGVRWHDCECGFAQRRSRVFCSSLADWLDDEVPIEWLADLLELIRTTPNLDWQLLTKRPENWAKRLNAVFLMPGLDESRENWILKWTVRKEAPANVWMGTTVENQEFANLRIPLLLEIPARVRFLSCEPLLGPVEIEEHLEDMVDGGYVLGSAPIHWVICGGESGAGARPMHPDWARSLRDQCASAGVPFFFKQWGEWAPGVVADIPTNTPTVLMKPDSRVMVRVGKESAGRLLDGKEHSAFPEATK